MERFVPIRTTPGMSADDRLTAMRLNGFGSLFYFTFVILKRRRLSASLHVPFCNSLERERFKDLIEIPRDHFKTTIASEGLPMWRALPLTDKDIDQFKSYGYSDEFVRWLIACHNPQIKTCIVSENITNAAGIGRRIRRHYESNDYYRGCYPETLPDSSCRWTDYSLSVKGSNVTASGEGTFDFLGVGSAIQSRHYNFLIQDDLVGRKAVESPSIMDKTIEYHQLLVGAFDDDDKNHEANELVIGNRWSYNDLNSHLREIEPWFNVESHSALGGCCAKHPPDIPIFPEEWTVEKLEKRKARLGTYHFSCQYLNNPAAPENADFKTAWLNYFTLSYSENGDWTVIHETKDGIVRKDLRPHRFNIVIVTDPNHSGNLGQGRCRHAIVVLAQSDDANFYLIDTWAQAVSFDAYYGKIFEMARKWNLHRIGVETVAAQKYVAHHIEHLAKNGWSLRIDELKGEVKLADGTMSRNKEWRIRNVIGPIAEQGRLWIQRHQQDFTTEYQTFPKGRYVDQLDCLAYGPQLLREPIDWQEHLDLLAANQAGMERLGHPYSAGMMGHA